MPLTFRVSPDAAAKIKQFLADYAGKPLYLKSGNWAEAALLRDIQRLELVLSGALPADRTLGDQVAAPVGSRRKPHLNAAT